MARIPFDRIISHAIIFGLHLPDRQFFSRSVKGNYSYWTSSYLEDRWSHGQILITDVTYETCSYVARYVVKKVDHDLKVFYSTLKVVPEFVVMSRRPGIAKKYYVDNKNKVFLSKFINVSTPKGGIKFKPPRYYQKLFEIDNCEVSESLKEFNKTLAEAHADLQNSVMSYTPSEQRLIQERNKERQIKFLKRGML